MPIEENSFTKVSLKIFPPSVPAFPKLAKIPSNVALPTFKPAHVTAILAKLEVKPGNTPVILLIVFSNKVNKSTAPLITSLLAKPIVNSSQASFSLASLVSNESSVLLNCSWDAPALSLAAPTNSIVLS